MTSSVGRDFKFSITLPAVLFSGYDDKHSYENVLGTNRKVFKVIFKVVQRFVNGKVKQSLLN